QAGTDGPHIESRVSALEDDARDQEIARMLGGERVSATTLAHAREMLGKPAAPAKARA
ncbi:MAG: hypothetical protein JSS56_02050, partial [Proteobacteria bacterium]|nr:hypothetical protein [Pseudomonadota bacterium]